MPSKRKREPFARRVNNATEFFYECAPYIKSPPLQPLFTVRSNTTPVVVAEDGGQVCRMARELLSGKSRTLKMQRIFLVGFTLFAVGIPGLVHASSRNGQVEQWAKGQPSSVSRDKLSWMNGCVNNQEGHCVLAGDPTPGRIAGSKANGFLTQAVGRYMGQRVTVREMCSMGGSGTRFEVRTVETASETYAPQFAQQKTAA